MLYWHDNFYSLLFVKNEHCKKKHIVIELIKCVYVNLSSEFLQSTYMFSLIATDILKKTPSDEDILFILCDIAFEWYQIGRSLQISHDFLDNLSREPDDIIVKLSNVIKKWKTTANSHCITWETVILAIENLCNFTDDRRYKVLAESGIYKRKVMEIQEYLTKGMYLNHFVIEILFYVTI